MENKPQGEGFVRQILSKEVSLLVAVIGIAFGVYTYITTPSRVNGEQIEYLKATIDKNQALTDALTKTQQNDLHTLEGRLDQQNTRIEELTSSIVKLSTIIEERIPQKK